MRAFVDAILAVIAAASLSDDEWDTITIESQTYTAELYAEILAVLDGREVVSNTRDRLGYYFQARGVTITTPSTAVSQVYVGSNLGCS